MRFLLRKMVCLCFMFASLGVSAEDINVVIKLHSIDAKKLTEKSGDEVYFSITQYSSHGGMGQTRVPMFPMHWLSRQLTSVKDVNLWQHLIKEDEAIQVILSLIEHDTPPWNLDDHLGSVKVTLVNKNGKLETDWRKADFKDQPEIEQIENSSKYLLKGDGSEYHVNFGAELIKVY